VVHWSPDLTFRQGTICKRAIGKDVDEVKRAMIVNTWRPLHGEWKRDGALPKNVAPRLLRIVVDVKSDTKLTGMPTDVSLFQVLK
jgi:hypothetical protein